MVVEPYMCLPQWRTLVSRILPSCLAFCAILTLAHVGNAAQPSIWYRASEGCPDGLTFLELLERRGVSAQLAAVGDRIDFVVTLGADGEFSSGRLERQTDRGTIALREVQNARCEAIAEVLALTLALTHDPNSQDAPETAAPADPPAEEPAPPAPTSVSPRVIVPTPPSRDESSPRVATEQQWALALGGNASAWDVFEGAWMLAVGLFGELEAPASFALPRATARVGLHGGRRADEDQRTQVWLLGSRLEVCPLALTSGRLTLRPCLAVDSGVLGARADGVSERAFWSAAATHGRLTLDLGAATVEAQAGGIVPLTRYEVGADSVLLEKTKNFGVAVGLGANFRIE